MTQFGLAIRNFVGPGEVPDVKALYAYAERAEALGFESLWAWDHVLLGVEPSFPIIDSITTLGAIAARTSTIKLGTGVLVLPLRNPVVAAKALGSLDVISGGRLILGVAAGWYAREFDAVGVPFKQRGRHLRAQPRHPHAPLDRGARHAQGRRVQPARGGHGARAPPSARGRPS